jgi:radical SAM protein with 4Fe4S-binding SPASM domain
MICMKLLNSIREKLRTILPLGLKLQAMTWMRISRAIYLRPRGYRHLILSAVSQMIHSTRAYGLPVSITLEPTNICNLRCPVCETGANILGRKPKMMTYEEFVKIIDKVGVKANHVMFYYMGEPFLNKDAYRMIRYARDMGLYVLSCTNGEVVDPVSLYESGINQISFQIGGIRQETHSIYRVNSNLARTMDNLSTYLEIIRSRGRKPGENLAELGFIVMRHNEGEIKEFIGIAEKIGVDRKSIINPCVRTPQQGMDFLPQSDTYWIYERRKFEQEGCLVPKRIYPENSCPWLYYSITIHVDGNVVPCCRDPHGQHIVGNLLEQSLEEVWNGPKIRAFRSAVFRNQAKVDTCRLCPGEGLPALFKG